MLSEAPASYVEMITFYTRYWNANADILTAGEFIPSHPLANYPTQRVFKDGKSIIGVYNDHVVELKSEDDEIHILNGQVAEQVTICNTKDLGRYQYISYNCRGEKIVENTIDFSKGVLEIAVPPCGILMCERTK